MHGARRWVAATAVLALSAALPAPAGAAESLPKPKLSQRLVTPSSCPEREDQVAYDRRPAFTATTGVSAPKKRRMEFEVWVHEASELSARGRAAEGLKPEAHGVADAKRAGGSTFAWRADAKLPDDSQLVWRTRVRAGGEAVTDWSGWQQFVIRTDMPRLHECRVGEDFEFWYDMAREEGVSVGQLLGDQLWLGDFYAAAQRIRKAYPKSFVAAEVVDSRTRRAWIAFRHGAPSGAKAALARFRSTHPHSKVAVLTGRDFTEKQVRKRMDDVYDLLSASKLTGSGSGGVDLRTGTLVLEFENGTGGAMTDAEVRSALFAEVRKHVSAYRIVESGKGVLAGPDVQPVNLFVYPEQPEEEPWG